jgi:hypothetical protein
LKQNGAPSGAVFVSSDPRAGNAVNRVGYGDEPTGVPLPELGRQPVERVLDVIDERLDAYRNAPTAAARDQALDEALDAAYAHRIQGGDGAGFDRILAELSDDPSARTHARVMRERADQVVASTAGGNVRALNDSGINFGSQLQALQQAIKNDSDNAYPYISRFASWLKSTDHLASNVPEQEAFGKLVTHMGYGRELGAARLALARRADEEIAEQRAAFARMSAAEKKAYLAERSYDNGLPWTLPDFGISAAILPFGPPPPGSRRTTKSGGGAAKQDPASERGGEQRGPPPVGLGDTSRQAPPASGAPSGAASDSAGQYAGARFGQATSKDYRETFFKAHPHLEGKVIVHHAVEKAMHSRYPNLVTWEELHSLENLRGIPKELNDRLHLSEIRIMMNEFYRQNPQLTKEMLLKQATEVMTISLAISSLRRRDRGNELFPDQAGGGRRRR